MKPLMYFAVTALSLSLTVPALADTLVTTPTITGTLPGGTVSGTLTIDTDYVPDPNTFALQSLVTSLDFTVDEDNTIYNFDSIHYQGVQSGEYYVDSFDASGDLLMIGFPLSGVGSLDSYSGFCVASSNCYYPSGFAASGQSGSQFTSLGNAPEPSSLILLG